MRINRLSIVVSTSITVVILDQLTKYLARNYLSQEGIFIIFRLFRLRFYKNPGVALGIPLSPIIFYPLFILLVIGFLVYFSKKASGAIAYSSLILAAAFSNLADRLRFGYVVDFIEIYPTGGPIFNLADIVIVVGILIMAWRVIRKHP